MSRAAMNAIGLSRTSGFKTRPLSVVLGAG